MKQNNNKYIKPKWLHQEANDNTWLLSLHHDEQQQSFSWRKVVLYINLSYITYKLNLFLK